MKRIAKYFLQGLVFLIPLAGTIYVFYVVFTAIDDLLGIRLYGRTIRGFGFFIVVAGTTFIGFLASNFLTRRVLGVIQGLFARMPLVKIVYSSLRDLISAFVGEKKGFDQPVLVNIFPGAAVKAAGFVTKTNLESLGVGGHVAVYLPQSYNFAGNLLIVPKENVTPLNLDSSKVMTFVISGGIAESSAPDRSPKPEAAA